MLGDQHSERQLEQALIANVPAFLREMGGMFTFVGSQYRLEVGEKEYFIDVLLYHRRLRCLIAVELKIGEFLPEYVGKMQFYLAALDDVVREEGEQPSIGILLSHRLDDPPGTRGAAACRRSDSTSPGGCVGQAALNLPYAGALVSRSVWCGQEQECNRWRSQPPASSPPPARSGRGKATGSAHRRQ